MIIYLVSVQYKVPVVTVVKKQKNYILKNVKAALFNSTSNGVWHQRHALLTANAFPALSSFMDGEALKHAFCFHYLFLWLFPCLRVILGKQWSDGK